MDRQAWIAIALCILGLVAWQVYVAKHTLPVARKSAASPAPSLAASPAPGSPPVPTPAEPSPAPNEPAPTPAPTPTPRPFVEKTATLKNSDLELLLTNRGGGIAEAILPQHRSENGGPVKLNARQYLPIGALIEKPAAPALEEFSIVPGAGAVEFERTLPNDVRLRKKFTLPAPPDQKDNYVVQLEVDFQNTGPRPYQQPEYFVALGSAGPLHRNDLPTYTRVTWCIDGKTRNTDVSWFGAQNYPFVGVQKRPAQPYFEERINNAEWVGVSNQFFVSLIAPLGAKADRVWAHRFEARQDEQGRPEYGIEGAMGMPGFAVAPGQSATVQFQLYVGPKLYHRLAQLEHDEAEIMDFGLWKLVSEALLNLMNLIHRFVGNYAIAILILTAIVKGILWPIQTKANKSMRRMAALSPKMQELREKFKDDPTKMNAEVMKLYKDYGINPVSGCLPMLIQIPIFFGLFTMLRQAVELRNASFLWVRDLSQPDTIAHIPGLGWPINILPLIMAATSFWMTAITPKSGDATQQRVMMFMPLIFVVFCYNFAAALALYYTTQNLFTILQLYQNRNQPMPKLEKVNQPAKRKGKGRG
jgi:YidC/Oxa1 family membrane protein insertase